MFTCSHSISQQVSLFQNITTANGLPSNYVFAADEDENGFLWIGTDKGLAKYDGFRWQAFNMDNGLPGNYIRNVFCTGKGGIWLGISTKGTYYYDIATGKCSFIISETWGYNSQRNKAGDLFFYNAFNGKKEITGNVLEVANPFVAKKVFELPVDQGNRFVMADFESNTVYYNPAFCTADEVRVYYNWKKDTIVAALNLSGIVTKVAPGIYKGTGTFIFPKNIALEKKINSALTQYYYLSSLHNKGITWYWNEADGLFNVDDKGNIKSYTDKEGLGTKIVHSAYQTKSGNLFISTLGGGLACMLPQGFSSINTENKPVKSLAQKDSYVYALTDDVILQIDIHNPFNIKKYTHHEKNIQRIACLNNDIVISSMNGFSVYNIINNQLIKKTGYKNSAGISSVIKQGNMVYAGTYGSNVSVMNAAYRFIKGDVKTPAVSEKLITLSQGYASINYEDGLQLNYSDEKSVSVSVKDGLPANTVYDVHEYKDTLWISTAKGVAAYTQGKVVQTFSFSNGIKGNRCIYSFHDKDGKYWVLTDKYLNAFDGKKFLALTAIAVSDGSNDVANSCLFNNSTNTLAVGSFKRIFFINPSTVKLQPVSTSPALAAIWFDGKKADSNYSITLPSQYNNLLLNFKSVDANPFAKSFIYYKLQGYHDNFIELKDSLSISFPKLRAGKYKLLAKTINANGIESREKILATISVDSPYWQKAWFIGLLAAAAAMGLYAVPYLIRRRKQKKIAALKLIDDRLSSERERISKDLHDHLGTAIVTMIAQTDNIETKLMNNNQQGALEKVKELSEQSRETVNVLRETIWAVQENTHTLDEFVLRTKNFLQRVLPQKNIEWNVLLEGDKNKMLTANESLQLFRVIQECTQNIIKHSRAGEAVFTFNQSAAQLIITIADNGIGISNQSSKAGNGLTNMQQRVQSIGSNITYGNKMPSGFQTTITLSTEKKK
jgi:signal transduction histidine kinase